ncbi:MAG: pyridoxamine 5'-phosphate oxidase [Bacteroidota bacterium]
MAEPGFPPLIEKDLDPNPITQFQRWFEEAQAANVLQLDAMALATATAGGKPSVRMVLLKSFDSEGFVCYTNYRSQKGKELVENPHAALVFYWEALHRQVRVEGTVSKVSPEESDAYFQTRPRESQISAWASQQSDVIGNRAELDRRFEELKKKFEGRPVPRPSQWGGYRLKPTRIEFWQARYARLNDRIVYELQKDGSWTMNRLSP